jgi:PTS system mannose-specific IID component
MFLHASYNYERLQGLGFAHAMKPVIEYLYVTAVERAAALKRHLVFFNSEPQFGALVPAAVIALEEERAAGANIPDETINSVKGGLMGPLAGVGDSLVQGLITPVLLSLGISLAQRGNLAGPMLYSLLISLAIIGSSYAFWMLGYRWGKAAVSRVLASGWVGTLTGAVSVVGMTVIGGLTASVVRLSTPASITVGQAVVSLQEDVLDPILRGLLPLGLTLFVWWICYRRVPSTRIIGLLFVLGIDLTYLGLAGGAAPPLFSVEWFAFLVGGVPTTAASAFTHLWPPLLATGGAVVAWTLWRRSTPCLKT